MIVEPLKEPFYFLSVPVVVNRTIYIQLSFKEISPQIILNFNSRNHLNFKHSYVKKEVFTGLFAANAEIVITSGISLETPLDCDCDG